jgi:hypothetical protein
LEDAALGELVDAAGRITAKLSKQSWGAPGQVILVNELAAGEIQRAGGGVFFFGVVEKTVSDDAGSRAALIQLAGMDQTVFVPLDGQLVELADGHSCLVLGVNYEGRVVHYGENPLKPIAAPVIVSRTLLPLSE